ncbi:MAG TPA: hypothetical protein VFS20_23485 [Longimicrobium sp.]|nr:hypothetical protein [Longimicrobium sp.]
MNFDQLAEVWRSDDAGTTVRSPADEVAAVRARAAGLARDVRRRDRLETGAALVVFPFFAWIAARAPSPVSAVGAVIVMAACVLIPLRLRRARHGDVDPALPLAWALRAELARVRAQERLLGSVAWWYLAPLGIGVILVRVGAPGPQLHKAAYVVSVVALGAGLLFLNLRAVRREVRPLAAELERWLADLDGSPVHETFLPGAPDAS